MKKKFLILAGVLALTACAKEAYYVSPDEEATAQVTAIEGNFALSVDRNADNETKTIFNSADYKKSMNLWWYKGDNQDKLGVYVLNDSYHRNLEENDEDFALYAVENNEFTTTALAHQKANAIFTGTVNFPKEENDEDKDEYNANETFYVYAAYPYKNNGSLDMTMDFTKTIASLNVADFNPSYSANSFMLFRSVDTWGPIGDDEGYTNVAVPMEGANLTSTLDVSFSIPAADNGVTLKYITLEAYTDYETSEDKELVSFPTTLNADLEHFKNYQGKTFDKFAADFDEDSFVTSLTYNFGNNVKAYAADDDGVITNRIAFATFPTEEKVKAVKLTIVVEKTGYDEELVLEGWKNFSNTPGGVTFDASARYNLDFGELKGTNSVTVLNMNDLEAKIKAGYEYIKLDDNAFVYGATTPILTLPAEGDDSHPAKNITIAGFGKNSVDIWKANGSPIESLTLTNTGIENFDDITGDAFIRLSAPDVDFNMFGDFKQIDIQQAKRVVLGDPALEAANKVNKLTVTEVEDLTINCTIEQNVTGIGTAKSFVLGENGTIKVADKLTIGEVEDVDILGTVKKGNDAGDVTIAKANNVTINAKEIGDVEIEKAAEEVSITGKENKIGNVGISSALAETTADVTLAGVLGRVDVYTTGALTVEEGAVITKLDIVSANDEEEAIPSVSSVTINGKVTNNVEIPATAKSVEIGEYGEVYGLILNDGIETVEIDGKVAGHGNAEDDDYVAGDVDTKTATVVSVGEHAVINGNLTSTPGTAGEVTIEEGGYIIGKLTVANMTTVNLEGKVKGNYDVTNVSGEVNVVIPENVFNDDEYDWAIVEGQKVIFVNCKGAINLTSERATDPKVTFTLCTGADITITGYSGVAINLGTATSPISANVTFVDAEPTAMTVYATNITLDGGTFGSAVTLSAENNLILGGRPNEDDEEEDAPLHFANFAITLSGKDIKVGYVKFEEGFNSGITFTSDDGTITVGSEDYLTDFKSATIAIRGNAAKAADVKKPKNVTLTKCSVKVFGSYWSATFNKCSFAEGGLTYAWFNTTSPTTAATTDYNGTITYTLNNCTLSNNDLALSDLLNLIGGGNNLTSTHRSMAKIHYVSSIYGEVTADYNDLATWGLGN